MQSKFATCGGGGYCKHSSSGVAATGACRGRVLGSRLKILDQGCSGRRWRSGRKGRRLGVSVAGGAGRERTVQERHRPLVHEPRRQLQRSAMRAKRVQREADGAETREGEAAPPLGSEGGSAVAETAEPLARAGIRVGAAEGGFAGRNQTRKAGSSGHTSGGSARGH